MGDGAVSSIPEKRSFNSQIACRIGFALLSLVSLSPLAASLTDPQRDIRTDGPVWQEYQRRLRALRANRPKDELLYFWGSGGNEFRNVYLWVKAGPAVRGVGGLFRSLTLYVEDTAGNRVRTVPDELHIEPQPPARSTREGLPTKNGEAAALLIYGSGTSEARATISVVPFGMGHEILLPVERKAATPLQKTNQHTLPGPVPVDERQAKQLLEAARDSKSRDIYRARRWGAQRGLLFVQAQKYPEALDAFSLCETEIGGPLCLWGEVQTLRLLGRQKDAEEKADKLVREYPDSVPAQFVRPAADELWWTPYNHYFIR